MDGHLYLSPFVHPDAGTLPPPRTAGDVALWEARRAGIPLELAVADGQVVLRATRCDGARLRLTGPADALADLVDELAARCGIPPIAAPHEPNPGSSC